MQTASLATTYVASETHSPDAPKELNPDYTSPPILEGPSLHLATSIAIQPKKSIGQKGKKDKITKEKKEKKKKGGRRGSGAALILDGTTNDIFEI